MRKVKVLVAVVIALLLSVVGVTAVTGNAEAHGWSFNGHDCSGACSGGWQWNWSHMRGMWRNISKSGVFFNGTVRHNHMVMWNLTYYGYEISQYNDTNKGYDIWIMNATVSANNYSFLLEMDYNGEPLYMAMINTTHTDTFIENFMDMGGVVNMQYHFVNGDLIMFTVVLGVNVVIHTFVNSIAPETSILTMVTGHQLMFFNTGHHSVYGFKPTIASFEKKMNFIEVIPRGTGNMTEKQIEGVTVSEFKNNNIVGGYNVMFKVLNRTMKEIAFKPFVINHYVGDINMFLSKSKAVFNGDFNKNVSFNVTGVYQHKVVIKVSAQAMSDGGYIFIKVNKNIWNEKIGKKVKIILDNKYGFNETSYSHIMNLTNPPHKNLYNITSYNATIYLITLYVSHFSTHEITFETANANGNNNEPIYQQVFNSKYFLWGVLALLLIIALIVLYEHKRKKNNNGGLEEGWYYKEIELP